MEVTKQWSSHWVKWRLQLRKFRFPFKTHPIEQFLRWFKITCKEYRKVIWISTDRFRFYVSHKKFLGLESDSMKLGVLSIVCQGGWKESPPQSLSFSDSRLWEHPWWVDLVPPEDHWWGRLPIPPREGKGPVKRWLNCHLPIQLL